MSKEFNIIEILHASKQLEASDIHFKKDLPVYLRIKGRLEPLEMSPLDDQDLTEVTNSILDEKRQTELKDSGDVDCSFKQKEESIRYRVHACKEDNGISIDLRVVPSKIIPIEKIGFPYGAMVWGDITNRLYKGLVLITGPTNSGKTTTIASLLQKINETRAEHIITIEDPVEYELKPAKSIISQREVGFHLPSFEQGLEAALRQDPNIILVGEIRNSETAHIALRAALTGHLVFSTRHSGTTVEAITQFASLFRPEEEGYVRDALASCLNYVVSQRLIPYNKNTGRKLIMEVMNVYSSAAIKSNIRKKEDHLIQSAIQTGQKYGMITMDKRLKELYEQKEITLDDALAFATNSEEIIKIK